MHDRGISFMAGTDTPIGFLIPGLSLHQEIQELYRIIYLRSMNNSQAINFIEAEVKASKERDEIISFIQDSKRGIMKGYFK